MSETKQTYPNAGPNCDLSKYRTGETPMVGDVVRCSRFESATVIRVDSDGYVWTDDPNFKFYGYRACDFDLIRRADSPDADRLEIRRRFRELADEWRRETGHLSKVGRQIAHPAYKEIVKMGRAVVPLILDDISRDGGCGAWFLALTEITGEDPIPASAAGDVNKMAAAWLEWREHGGISRAADSTDAGKMVDGPGKYVEHWPHAVEPQLATIFAQIDAVRFIGIDSFGRPDIWTVMGLPERYDGVRLIGRYVEPQPAPEPTLLEAADTCFLLEDDEPSQHGKPIACTQCWNALSEMQRESASRAALLSVAANEYQALVDWIFKAGSPMPPENTTAHRIASLIRELQAKLRAKGGG